MICLRKSVATVKAAVDQDRIRYNEAGAIVLQMQRKVYLGVITQLGEKFSILKSMGYVRKSERKSGLTRRVVIQTYLNRIRIWMSIEN